MTWQICSRLACSAHNFAEILINKLVKLADLRLEGSKLTNELGQSAIVNLGDKES